MSLSSLQSQVAQAERINYELRAQLTELENGVNRARQSWDQLAGNILNTLANGNSRLISSHNTTQQTTSLEEQIEQAYALFKNVELSNKKIRECNNKIYYDFANYTRVRKIVEGMLNNLEVTMVSDATLTKAIEIEHLKLPDYWLTCAMLALMAWRNDDRQMAEKALERACKLDLKTTSIFFFTVYLRMGRYSAALPWFEAYTECDRTGGDTHNILFMFSILTKNIGDADDDRIYAKVDEFVKTLIQENLQSSGYSEEDMVNRICNSFLRMRQQDAFNYPLLRQQCADHQRMHGMLVSAKNNINILDFIRKVTNVTAKEKHNRINAFMDEVIRRANTTEVAVRNEIHYHETVINYGGNLERAQADYDAWLKHKETELNLISEMVDWVYDPKDEEIGPEERARFFYLTKDLSEKAAKQYVSQYRSLYTNTHDITLGEYQSTADFKDPNTEYPKIESFYHTREQAELAQVKVWPAFIGFGVGVLGIVGAIALSQPALLVVTAGGVIAGVAKILLSNREKKMISLRCEEQINQTKTAFNQLVAEYNQFVEKFREYDNYVQEIAAEFAKL